MPLAKPQLLSHYREATKHASHISSSSAIVDSDDGKDILEGVIFIETDVRYSPPTSESNDVDVAVWAKGPLEEIRFLRDVVQGHYDSDQRDSKMLLGLVPWAPMDQPMAVLEHYLQLAEEAAGEKTWRRVKGFRFLLQAIRDQTEFENLVLSESFIANLRLLGQRGFAFDVGVDQRQGGSWQLEIVAEAMAMAHEGVQFEDKTIFVVNHLCKPDFEAGIESEASRRWRDAVTAMSKLDQTYMKLSGAFSELPSTLEDASSLVARIRPWVAHVLATFGPERTMFGSDWPVCTLSARGESAWAAWKDVMAVVLGELRVSEEGKDAVWSVTARRAYRLSE